MSINTIKLYRDEFSKYGYNFIVKNQANKRINIIIQSKDSTKTCGVSCSVTDLLFIKKYLINKLKLIRK